MRGSFAPASTLREVHLPSNTLLNVTAILVLASLGCIHRRPAETAHAPQRPHPSSSDQPPDFGAWTSELVDAQCCGLPLPDSSGTLRRAYPPGLPFTQQADIRAGCIFFKTADQLTGFYGTVKVAGQPLFDFRILSPGTCEVTPSSLQVRWVEGLMDLGEVPNPSHGLLLGCGTRGEFASDGKFRAEVVDPDGCQLDALVFLQEGHTVGCKAWTLEGMGPFQWKCEPETVSRSHWGMNPINVNITRDAAGALVAIYTGRSLVPAPPSPMVDLYTRVLSSNMRILSIEGRSIPAMSGSEFVAATARLLSSIEAGQPLPFEVWQPGSTP
jgi:hypothetical protein